MRTVYLVDGRSIIRTVIMRETDKSYFFDRTKSENVMGIYDYVPKRASKGDHYVFDTLLEAARHVEKRLRSALELRREILEDMEVELAELEHVIAKLESEKT